MLEYVMSGTGHSKIHYSTGIPNEELVSLLRKYIQQTNDDFPNQEFSMLYNAYQETGYGENMKKHLNPFSIHADSGGLQMLTGNKTISTELKKEVYRHQAKYSTVAMSFDDIPVKQEGKLAVVDMSSRLFDHSRHVECATSSANNIIDQLEVFEELDSDAKVMAIIQGNCIETLVEWCDILFDTIPERYHSRIFGLSVSGAVMGSGEMQDVERIFSLSQMKNCPPNVLHNLHLLGIGSYKRLMPALIMRDEGVINKNTHISYDSTSHTSGLSMGRYFRTPDSPKGLGKNVSFGKTWNKIYEDIYYNLEDIFKINTDLNIHEDLFFDVVSKNTETFKKKHGEDYTLERHLISFLMCLGSVYNFMRSIDKIEKKKMYYQVSPDLYGLHGVESLQDFNQWKSFVSSKLKSQRVETSEKNTLSSFFGE